MGTKKSIKKTVSKGITKDIPQNNETKSNAKKVVKTLKKPVINDALRQANEPEKVTKSSVIKAQEWVKKDMEAFKIIANDGELIHSIAINFVNRLVKLYANHKDKKVLCIYNGIAITADVMGGNKSPRHEHAAFLLKNKLIIKLAFSGLTSNGTRKMTVSVNGKTFKIDDACKLVDECC